MAAVLLLASLLIALPAAPSSAQTAAPQVEFDVASIRQSDFPDPFYFEGYVEGGGTCAGARPQILGTRVVFRRATLCGLLRFAYDVKDYQIVDMPRWMTDRDPSLFYDIETRVGDGSPPTVDELRTMLERLLVDRFRLMAHREPRELPAYALTVEENGPRFEESLGDYCTGLPTTAFRGGRGLFVSCGATTSMEQLAVTLSGQTDRPVVDRTGLTGRYAFGLAWAPTGVPGVADEVPSIFTAVQEQLGLKLEPRAMPVSAIVIDRVERPSPN